MSKHFIEAGNARSVDAPHAVSEWRLSGFALDTEYNCEACSSPGVDLSTEAKLIEVVDLKTDRRCNPMAAWLLSRRGDSECVKTRLIKSKVILI